MLGVPGVPPLVRRVLGSSNATRFRRLDHVSMGEAHYDAFLDA